MLWTADSVEYRGVSMEAAYSGDTLIWRKARQYEATLVTSMTQIDSASTYVLACPFVNASPQSVTYLGVTDGFYPTRPVNRYFATTTLQGVNNTIIAPNNVFRFRFELLSGTYYALETVNQDFHEMHLAPYTDDYEHNPTLILGSQFSWHIIEYSFSSITGYTVRHHRSSTGNYYIVPTGTDFVISRSPELSLNKEVAMLYKITGVIY